MEKEAKLDTAAFFARQKVEDYTIFENLQKRGLIIKPRFGRTFANRAKTPGWCRRAA